MRTSLLTLLLIVSLASALVAEPVTTTPADAPATHASGTDQNDRDTVSPASTATAIASALPWWGWALLLFGFTTLLGVIAVIGGVGGGVLFVPIVSALFPFHFDFIRGAGLMVALCGALSAAPRLLRSGMASIRLGLPLALVGSAASIGGASLGLVLPTSVVELLLGISIVGIATLMIAAPSGHRAQLRSDPIASALGIRGNYHDSSVGHRVGWTVHRTGWALVAYIGIGIIGGMFGLGAGWANVPTLTLLMGAPIKVAVATSGYIMTLNSSAAAWVYLNGGAVLGLITVPSIAGMMVGTKIGARLLPRVRPRVIRRIVTILLVGAGLRSLVAGLIGVIG